MIFRTEGIILKVIDFRDHDQIMTVFTQDRGLVKWIFKKWSHTGKSMAKISPFTRAEFIYLETKSDIWKCREISFLNQYLKLRENYAWLETAGRLINWIMMSQVEQKPAPRLYKFLVVYLEKIPVITNLRALEVSFIIKILMHEGLINFEPDYLGKIFNDEEMLSWLKIAACQTFSELQTILVPESLPQKAELFFKNLIS